jgi:hypothetical protein
VSGNKMTNKKHSKKPAFLRPSQEIGNTEILRSKNKKINKVEKKIKNLD